MLPAPPLSTHTFIFTAASVSGYLRHPLSAGPYIHYTEELAASQDRIFSHSMLVSAAAIPQSIYLL